MNELALITAGCAAVCLSLRMVDDGRSGAGRVLDVATLVLTLVVVGCLIVGSA